MRTIPIDGWWIAPSGREERGFAHLLRRPALRCVTLRYVRVTDLLRTASFRKRNKYINKGSDIKEEEETFVIALLYKMMVTREFRTIIGYSFR